MMFPKLTPWRSSAYLTWVRTLPCVVCEGPASDAHHLIGVGNLRGMGTKTSDTLTMPVCRGCHTRIHNEPELWEEQWKWVSLTLDRAVREGVLSLSSR